MKKLPSSQQPKVVGHRLKGGGVVCVKFAQDHSLTVFESVQDFENHCHNWLENVELVKQFVVAGSSMLVEKVEAFFKERCPQSKGRRRLVEDGHWILVDLQSGKLKLKKSESVSKPPPPAPTVLSEKLRLLMIEDSKTMRKVLKKIFSMDPRIEVVGEAETAEQGLQLIESVKPDVVTLDINLPKMDGVEFLRTLGSEKLVPTVLITSLNINDGDKVFSALELGAVDYIQKPDMNDMKAHASVILDKVKTAARANMGASLSLGTQTQAGEDVVFQGVSQTPIFIGSSTGGTNALQDLFTKLQGKVPPIVVVQHIPALFSKAFADRLNSLVPFTVKEAQDGDRLMPEHVYIAPGGMQVALERTDSLGYSLRLKDDAPVNGFKPSVDYFFQSITECYKGQMTGVILTGMGKDGAEGLKSLKEKGASTIAQSKESCVVFGMPRVAIELGCVDHVCHLDEIPRVLKEIQETHNQKKGHAA